MYGSTHTIAFSFLFLGIEGRRKRARAGAQSLVTTECRRGLEQIFEGVRGARWLDLRSCIQESKSPARRPGLGILKIVFHDPVIVGQKPINIHQGWLARGRVGGHRDSQYNRPFPHLANQRCLLG